MIYLVGMGPGNSEYLTGRAIDIIKSCDKVIAFGRIGRTAEIYRDRIHSVKRVEEVTSLISDTGDTAVLASGDPCFYGILNYLKEKGIEPDEVVPGLSSFQYLMAKLKLSWQDAALISLHGRESDLNEVKSHGLSVILTDRENNPDAISKRLCDMGVKGSLICGFNLSYDNEVIERANIGESFSCNEPLAVVVVINEVYKR